MLGIYIEREEAVQIAISVLAMSLAMGLVFAGLDGMFGHPREFLVFIPPLIVTVGSGFILHEMAHKLVAMWYGAEARFRMWTQGIVLMLVTSVFGFLFAAPGAVYIYAPGITARQNGIISLAGPALNFALAAVFVGLELAAPVTQFFSFLAPWGTQFSGFGIVRGMLHVWWFGAAMNIMLGLFNMIPAFPLDGSKIYHWSRPAWLGGVAAFLAVGSFVISPGIVFSWALMLLFFWVLSHLLFGWSSARR